MPPQTVKCSICGDEVFKRQTYAVGDGQRACKKHEGVTDAAHDLQIKQAVVEQYDLEFQPKVPELNFDQLVAYSAVFETFTKPIYDDIARQELGLVE